MDNFDKENFYNKTNHIIKYKNYYENDNSSTFIFPIKNVDYYNDIKNNYEGFVALNPRFVFYTKEHSYSFFSNNIFENLTSGKYLFGVCLIDENNDIINPNDKIIYSVIEID